MFCIECGRYREKKCSNCKNKEYCAANKYDECNEIKNKWNCNLYPCGALIASTEEYEMPMGGY